MYNKRKAFQKKYDARCVVGFVFRSSMYNMLVLLAKDEVHAMWSAMSCYDVLSC